MNKDLSSFFFKIIILIGISLPFSGTGEEGETSTPPTKEERARSEPQIDFPVTPPKEEVLKELGQGNTVAYVPTWKKIWTFQKLKTMPNSITHAVFVFIRPDLTYDGQVIDASTGLFFSNTDKQALKNPIYYCAGNASRERGSFIKNFFLCIMEFFKWSLT